MTPEQKAIRRYERVGRKWDSLKSKRKNCPNCWSYRIGLNDSFIRTNKLKRFWLECDDCHWCGKSYPTIRLAIWGWNLQKRNKNAPIDHVIDTK